ncbi:MAG: L-glutamate gamma-semialdehyde dehydrogenase [Firmicutes bacterium]|nr:L-glutamate gamma-semialdehyde dehydrogenase [Bacillota bacterium]
MFNASYSIPKPVNEKVLTYAPHSNERRDLSKKLDEIYSEFIEIPIIIDGKEVRTGDTSDIICPHEHKHKLGKFHKVNEDSVLKAIKAAKGAKRDWAAMPFKDRASIFLRAAELIAGHYRFTLNASTMLCQSKSCHQAEIDSACELIDFLRFNAHFAESIYNDQPFSVPGVWNYVEYRPLEGFVYAVTPFNFTAIAGNLPTSPALMGNTVVWKPASTAIHSGYHVMKILKEAGLPDGVINFVPGSGNIISSAVFKDPDLGGIHFTGSTDVFSNFWKTIADNLSLYKSYPVLIGETGGKNFVFVHPSADISEVAAGIIRGAFEYQGQKCSAASRAYIPRSMWLTLKEILVEEIKTIKLGDVRDFSNFMNAVIDKASFDRITGYINKAGKSPSARIISGGKGNDSTGYFIEPTVIEALDPYYETMQVELFGPVITVYVYEDNKYEETLEICNGTSPFGLTGAIFARDRAAIQLAHKKLLYSAGNFYVNDKPTGAVVGQQPFGGSRYSGTNDKAGSSLNLRRWTNPRTVKENFSPVVDYRYPFLNEEPSGPARGKKRELSGV